MNNLCLHLCLFKVHLFSLIKFHFDSVYFQSITTFSITTKAFPFHWKGIFGGKKSTNTTEKMKESMNKNPKVNWMKLIKSRISHMFALKSVLSSGKSSHYWRIFIRDSQHSCLVFACFSLALRWELFTDILDNFFFICAININSHEMMLKIQSIMPQKCRNDSIAISKEQNSHPRKDRNRIVNELNLNYPGTINI